MDADVLWRLFQQYAVHKLESVCPGYDLRELHRRLQVRQSSKAQGGTAFKSAHRAAMHLIDMYPVEDILNMVSVHVNVRIHTRTHTHARAHTRAYAQTHVARAGMQDRSSR